MNFLNNEISFYVIDHEYMRYLHGIDSCVYFHEDYKRLIKPYVGIMITIDRKKYFIPLTSAKPRHSNQRLKTRDHILIYDIVDIIMNEPKAVYKDNPNDPTKKYHILGVLDIRKMIPVPDGMYHKINFRQLELNYQFLFYKEHEFCKSVQDDIITKATNLYEKAKQKGKKISNFHCDYILLEQSMLEYVK